MKSLAKAFGAGVIAAALVVAAATALDNTDGQTGGFGLVVFAILFAVLVGASVVMGVFGREFARRRSSYALTRSTSGTCSMRAGVG